MNKAKSAHPRQDGFKPTPGTILLLLLGFIGIAIGAAVALAGYRGTNSINRCLANPQCAGGVDLLRTLSQLSTDRAELDIGVALLIFSVLLVVYLIMRDALR